jgi:hypothetical protein
MTNGTGTTTTALWRMCDVTSPDQPTAPVSPRIGSAERQRAMDALDVHLSAGRLDPDEYGERVGRASVARTAADLEPLFADLPAPHADVSAPTSVSRAQWTPPAPSPPSGPVGSTTGPVRKKKHHGGREPLGGRVGEVVVAASPFVAVALFFLTGKFWDEAWLIFLLVPLAGAVVYGRDWGDD